MSYHKSIFKTLNNNPQPDPNGMTCLLSQIECIGHVLDVRIKTKITASHTLNEKTNKQTKRKQKHQQHSPQELHGNTGID